MRRLSRRAVLKLMAVAASVMAFGAALAGQGSDKHNPSVGIALGAGGAAGLAHVLMLEALDERGIRPRRIAGSSIGAIIGALYASGNSGREIRSLIEEFFATSGKGAVQSLVSDEGGHWFDMIDVELGNGGLLASGELMSFLLDKIGQTHLEDLDIPLFVVAGDLWNREAVVLDSGPLRPAVQASMAIPGVFEPVSLDGRVLIDGGTVNPVPFDLLAGCCDVTVAIDVTGFRTPGENSAGYFETLFNSVKVMQQAIVREKLRHAKPDIYIKPEITDVRALEFHRAREIFQQAAPAKTQLASELGKLLERR